MAVNIDEFIKNHTYINYCEAVIHRDGTIEYAVPSHVETLMRITNEDRQVIWDKMPITASPIIWLTHYTGCVSVWTNGYFIPKDKTTVDQLETIFKLVEAKLVRNWNIFDNEV